MVYLRSAFFVGAALLTAVTVVNNVIAYEVAWFVNVEIAYVVAGVIPAHAEHKDAT